MKKKRTKKIVIELLEKTPIVSAVCDLAGVSRQTFYAWKKEDPEFERMVESAMNLGNQLICDVSESRMMSKVKDGRWPAIKYVLDNLHPKYKKKSNPRNHTEESIGTNKQSFIEQINKPIDTSNLDPKLLERLRKRREESSTANQENSS